MARTTIAPEVVPTGYPLTIEAVVWTAADNANGNQFAWTGKELLLVYNAHATLAKTWTPTSFPINGREDPKSGVAQSLAVGILHVYNFRGEGWKQADGYVYLTAEGTDVKFMVIQCPI